MVKQNKFTEKLQSTVLENSKSKDWFYAVGEWYLLDWDEDWDCGSACICGKENIKYLFTIKNRHNGNELGYIGSTCIQKFGRPDIYDEAKTIEELYRLQRAYKEKQRLDLSMFSRKLIEYLYYDGAFDNGYYSAKDTFRALRDMYNKKNPLTYRQQNMVTAIIMQNIIPYLRGKLN